MTTRALFIHSIIFPCAILYRARVVSGLGSGIPNNLYHSLDLVTKLI